MLERPAVAKIPSTERTHSKSNTEATARNGPGKIPITQIITKKMRISHKVTKWLFNEKRTTLGTETPDMGTYPKNQSIIRIITIAINIIYSACCRSPENILTSLTSPKASTEYTTIATMVVGSKTAVLTAP